MHFEFAYFSFFLIHLELKRPMRSYTPVISSKSITNSRPKWAKSMPVFRPLRLKNATPWGCTYQYGLYKGVPPLPGVGTVAFPNLRVHTYGGRALFVWYMLVKRRSPEGHYTSFTTECKSHVLLAANLQLKPSLRRREKLAGKVGRREIYPPVPPPPPGPFIKTLSMASSVSVLAGLTQWRGRGARPLFLDQNEARRAEKNFLSPPPLISGSG